MNRQPPIKLRLQIKGLFFILLPIVFQIILFVQLMHVSQESEDLLQEDYYLYELGLLNFNIASDFSFAYMSIMERISGPAKNYKMNPNVFLSTMLSRCQRVRQLRSEIRIPFRDVTPEAEKQARAVYNLMIVPDSQMRETTQERLPMLLAQEKKLDLSYRRLIELKRMNDEATDDINRIRERNSIKRQELKSQLNLGLIVEIAMTIFLLSVFLSDISKRLSRLVRNAQLLPTLEKLPVRVGGSDELAYLDTVLHNASAELRKAAEHREMITHMVAHDMRSPLASMKLGLKLLLDEQTADVRGPRVQALIRSVSQLTTLAENLLTLDKAKTSTLEVESELIDFAQIAGNAVETLSAKADEKQVKLVNKIEKTLALGDAPKLEQVLTNLISNAIKYSPEGKDVIVACEKRPRECVVSVQDFGPGVPKDKQKDIFEKGVQVDPGTKAQGFGLGLTICKQIVTAHNGSIGVNSEPGNGSTFWFSIPADNDDDESD